MTVRPSVPPRTPLGGSCGRLKSRGRVCAAGVVMLMIVAGCGGGGASQKNSFTVLAAASLRAPLSLLEAQFESSHPGVDVTISYGGSSDLATQILAGAPADVFASADTATMDQLGDRAVGRQDFATNTLQIVVPPRNPAGVTSLADLADPGLDVVVCAPEVPCGSAARRLADAAGVELAPDSQEQAVTDVLGKVAAGEADAGLVYVTDVIAAGDTVQGIAVPEAATVVNTYPIAVVEGAQQDRLAQEFVDLVLSDRGQRVLRDAGFGPP